MNALQKRLLTVCLLLLVGLSSVLFLPKSKTMRDSAMRLDPPLWVDDWACGPKLEPEQRVTQALEAHDYDFRIFTYEPTGRGIQVNTVLSGENLDQNIHRAERCLKAQGHYLIGSGTTERIALPTKNDSIPVRRLSTGMKVEKAEAKEDKLGPERRFFTVYYWFVGQHHITANHYDRTLTDIKDRIIRGETQRWTYTMVLFPVSGDPKIDAPFDEEVRRFMGGFAEKSINWAQVDPTCLN